MKTTLHLPHHLQTVRPAPRVHVRAATLRLGIVLSVLAVVFAVVVEVAADLPVVFILVPVVVVGFVLSWHASGRADPSQER
jgi:hypothetical protein